MVDFGTAVINEIAKSNLSDIQIKTLGYDNCFVKHGSIKEIEKLYKLDTENIIKSIKLFN